MKKILSIALLACILVISGCQSVNIGIFKNASEEQASDRICKFVKTVGIDNDVILIRKRALNDGGVRFVSDELDLRQLPDELNTVGDLENFTVYNDKIYFLACEGGSDALPGYIYSCDLNGNNITLLDNSLCSYSNCFIKDGYIYYDTYPELTYAYVTNINEDEYYQNHPFNADAKLGIYKMKLDGSDKRLIVPDKYLHVVNKDGVVGYVPGGKGWSYYQYDDNGGSIGEYEHPKIMNMGTYDIFDEPNTGIIYYVSDDKIKRIDKDGNEETLLSIPSDQTEIIHVGIQNVTPEKLYYDVYPHEHDTELKVLDLK